MTRVSTKADGLPGICVLSKQTADSSPTGKAIAVEGFGYLYGVGRGGGVGRGLGVGTNLGVGVCLGVALGVVVAVAVGVGVTVGLTVGLALGVGVGVLLDRMVRKTSFVSYVTCASTPGGAIIETFANVVPLS